MDSSQDFDHTIQSEVMETTQIKSYRKTKLLGTGSYGKVYLAQDESDSIFVMKVLPNTDTVWQEAKILQQLDHPNIVRYQEAFIDSKNRVYGTLGQYIKGRNQPIQENQIVEWFTQICLALQHVHSHKILHRDIKAENVFLHDDKIKLGDFGISRSVEKSLAKTFIGTPYYISPEIVQNQPYSYKSDVWSAGVLLYEMCTQKYPFQGESLPSLAMKIMKGKYQPISAQIYSQNMKNLIQGMLTVDLNKRLTMEQVIQSSLLQSKLKNVKIPLCKLRRSNQYDVVIKKDENLQNKAPNKNREEQRNKMKKEIQQKLQQQSKANSNEVIIDYFGQPKQYEQEQQPTKQQKPQKDIPVKIYLPFLQNPNTDQNNAEQPPEQSNKKDIKLLSFEKIEKIRIVLESAFGTEEFIKIYNIFKTLLENNTIDQITETYGPTYEQLLPKVNQEILQTCLSSMILLIKSENNQ